MIVATCKSSQRVNFSMIPRCLRRTIANWMDLNFVQRPFARKQLFRPESWRNCCMIFRRHVLLWSFTVRSQEQFPINWSIGGRTSFIVKRSCACSTAVRQVAGAQHDLDVLKHQSQQPAVQGGRTQRRPAVNLQNNKSHLGHTLLSRYPAATDPQHLDLSARCSGTGGLGLKGNS